MKPISTVMRIVLFGVILTPGSVLADTYDFTDGESRKARFVDQQGPVFMLNTAEFPNQTFPSFVERTFVYYIEKVRSGEPVMRKTLDESARLLEQGNTFFFKRDYRNAIRLYEDALRLNPDLRYAYNNIAVCFLLMGEFQQSIAWTGRLLEVEGLNGYAYFYRGLCYARLENYTHAYDDLKIARAIFEDDGGLSESAMCEELLEEVARRKFPR